MIFYLYFVVLSATVQTVDGDATCDCNGVAILQANMKKLMFRQRLESARIRRLEAKIEKTGPNSNDRLDKLEKNMRDINVKLSETDAVTKDKQIGFRREIETVVNITLVAEEKERQNLISDINEKLLKHKEDIEALKDAVNNTLDTRMDNINTKLVENNKILNERLDQIENGTSNLIGTVFNNISSLKNDNSIEVKEINKTIHFIASGLTFVNQSVKETKNMVDKLVVLVKEEKGRLDMYVSDMKEQIMEYNENIEAIKGAINDTLDSRFENLTVSLDKFSSNLNIKIKKQKEGIEAFKDEVNNTIDSRFENMSAEQFKYKDMVNKRVDRLENNTANFIGIVSHNISTLKKEFIMEEKGRLDSIQGLNKSIQFITSDLTTVNKSLGETRDVVDKLGVTVNEENGRLDKFASNMNEKIMDYKGDIEAFKDVVNNTIELRFENMSAKRVEYQYMVNKRVDRLENDTANLIGIVFYNISTLKNDILLEVNGRLHSIQGLNKSIQFITSDLTTVNQSLGETRDVVDKLGVAMKENKVWGQWSQWTGCSATCNAKIRERVRTCDSSFGCIGNSKDFSICSAPCNVRLVGGSSRYEGRLEVWNGVSWGTVCDDGFEVESATVVCRMLNYPSHSPQVYPKAHYGEGTLPIHLDDVACTGTESSLSQCSAQRETHNCGHDEDVGVRCQ